MRTETTDAPVQSHTRVPACEVSGLSVAYRARVVLRNVSFQVASGSIMGIVGPNGAGKSTLMKAMLGLIEPVTGTSKFFGEALRNVRRRVAYMPQSSGIDWDFPMSVLDAVTMGTLAQRGWFRRPDQDARARAATALARVELQRLHSRQIGELSGGQRQRVLLARTLAQAPDLWLLDEPFQGVDARSRDAIVRVLHGLRAAGKTIVLVHHDLATLADYCDHVTLLNGTVVASGPIEMVFTKANIRATYDTGSDDFIAGAT